MTKTQELITGILEIVPIIENIEKKELLLKACEKLAYLQNKLNSIQK